jgi:hypothetical protein
VVIESLVQSILDKTLRGKCFGGASIVHLHYVQAYTSGVETRSNSGFEIMDFQKRQITA